MQYFPPPIHAIPFTLHGDIHKVEKGYYLPRYKRIALLLAQDSTWIYKSMNMDTASTDPPERG